MLYCGRIQQLFIFDLRVYLKRDLSGLSIFLGLSSLPFKHFNSFIVLIKSYFAFNFFGYFYGGHY